MRALMPSDMERALSALRDFTRRDILLRFYADRKPRSVEDVAKMVGVHRSVAFEHLERLVALGYLVSERRRGLPGKPAKIYSLTAGPVQISHPNRRFDALAERLAGALERFGEPGRQAAHEAGRSYGAAIANRGAIGVDSALTPLNEMGGEYAVAGGGRVVAGNCLFLEACRRAPIICLFHAGLLEGVMETSQAGVDVRSLGYQGGAACAYSVQATELERDLPAAAPAS